MAEIIHSYNVELFENNHNGSYRPDLFDKAEYTITDRDWKLYRLTYTVAYDDNPNDPFPMEYEVLFWAYADDGESALRELVMRVEEFVNMSTIVGIGDVLFYKWVETLSPEAFHISGTLPEVENRVEQLRHVFKKMEELADNLVDQLPLNVWLELVRK